jgi:hypothetical protein
MATVATASPDTTALAAAAAAAAFCYYCTRVHSYAVLFQTCTQLSALLLLLLLLCNAAAHLYTAVGLLAPSAAVTVAAGAYAAATCYFRASVHCCGAGFQCCTCCYSCVISTAVYLHTVLKASCTPIKAVATQLSVLLRTCTQLNSAITDLYTIAELLLLLLLCNAASHLYTAVGSLAPSAAISGAAAGAAISAAGAYAAITCTLLWGC